MHKFFLFSLFFNFVFSGPALSNRLLEACKNHDWNTFQQVVQENPNVLNTFDENPFLVTMRSKCPEENWSNRFKILNYLAEEKKIRPLPLDVIKAWEMAGDEKLDKNLFYYLVRQESLSDAINSLGVNLSEFPNLFKIAVRDRSKHAFREYGAESGKTDLYWLCEKDDSSYAETLLKQRVDIDPNKGEISFVAVSDVSDVSRQLEKYKKSPLYYCVKEGKTKLIEALLRHPLIDPNKGHEIFVYEKGIEIEKKNDAPLQLAVKEGNAEVFKLLVGNEKTQISQEDIRFAINDGFGFSLVRELKKRAKKTGQ